MPTPNRAYPYPGVNSAPDGPLAVQQLAEAVDLDVAAVDAKHVKAFGHAGVTNGFTAPGAGGRAPFDAAQQLRGGMLFDNTNDALTVPKDGLYRCTIQAYASGAGWGTQASVLYVTPAAGTGAYQPGLNIRHYREGTNGPPDTCHSASGTFPLKAGDKVFLQQWFTGNTNTWGTNGYNGTFIEVEYVQP